MKKGKVVICPECRKPVLRILEDIEPGTPITASLFEPLGDQLQPQDGSLMNSTCCNLPLLRKVNDVMFQFKTDEA